jgi:hypothetical protein
MFRNTQVLCALLALLLAVCWPIQAQEVGMTGLPVKNLGSIAPPETPNAAQKLALNVTGVNIASNNASQPKELIISSYGGFGALKMFEAFGEQKSMATVFSTSAPSNKASMPGANEEIKEHYNEPGRV